MKVIQIEADVLHQYKSYISAGRPQDIGEDAVYQRDVLKESESSGFRKYTGNVLCRAVSGNGVLVIRTEDGSELGFLLDVPVVVRKNVWFCIAAYNCDLEYESFSSGTFEKRLTPTGELATGMIPQLLVASIFSVLYQTHCNNRGQRQFKHFYWELTYVDFGQLICQVDGQDYMLHRGDLMFFTPYQVHKVLDASVDPVGYFTITFDINNDQFLTLKNVVISADSTVHRLVKDMLSEYNLNMPFYNEMIASQLQCLLIHVFRMESNCAVGAIGSSEEPESDNETVAKAIQVIENNLPHKISAEEIAQELYISATKLRHDFKENMGVSISEYIRDRKLKLAKIMLSKGNYSVTQVSDMLEFCSVCYFSSEFKKKYGMQPKEFERSITKLNP